MKIQKSYIKRIFFNMLVTMIVILVILGILITGYTRTVIGHELIELNQSVLRQTAKSTSRLLSDVLAFSDTLAFDSKIVEEIAAGSNEVTLRNDIKSRINEITWHDYQTGRAVQVFFAGKRGWVYPEKSPYPYQRLHQLYKGAQADDAQASQNPILLSWAFEENEKGLYRYTFQIIQEVRDLLTEEHYGYMLVEVSEKELWKTYMELDGDSRQFCVLDEDGRIISSRDKRLIGCKYIPEGKVDTRKSDQNAGYYISYANTAVSAFLYERIPRTDWYLLEQVEIQDVWNNLNRVIHFMAAGILAGVIIAFFMFRYYSGKTLLPVKEIEQKMVLAAGGDFSARADVKQEDEFGQIAGSFNIMVERIDQQVKKIREIEKGKRLAELDFLRAQINPHFIYNTLSSIRFYVEMNKSEKAGNMLLNFSKLLRRTLSRSEEFVPFADEAETIREYVNLQSMRYAGQFEFEYHIEEETLPCLIPNFITQPIVENAIFYSVGNADAARITYSAWIQDERFKIMIEDNGSGMSQEKIDEVLAKELNMNKVGVRNVKERIQLIYGEKYGLWIDSAPGKGTAVSLTLPVEKTETEEKEGNGNGYSDRR